MKGFLAQWVDTVRMLGIALASFHSKSARVRFKRQTKEVGMVLRGARKRVSLLCLQEILGRDHPQPPVFFFVGRVPALRGSGRAQPHSL